jgi:hypothetical protein
MITIPQVAPASQYYFPNLRRKIYSRQGASCPVFHAEAKPVGTSPRRLVQPQFICC